MTNSRLPGKAIGLFIFRVATVASHPAAVDLVVLKQRIEPLPQPDICHRPPKSTTSAPPIVGFPYRQTFRNALLNVLAVDHQPDSARFLQGLQALNHRGKLHPVVRAARGTICPADGTCPDRIDQHVRPSPDSARVKTGSVAKQIHLTPKRNRIGRGTGCRYHALATVCGRGHMLRGGARSRPLT